MAQATSPTRRQAAQQLAAALPVSLIASMSGMAWPVPAAQGTTPAPGPSRYLATRPPRPLPDLTVLDHRRRAIPSRSWRGAPLLLHLWASWCAPCVQELPELDRFAAGKASTSRVRIVAVAVDRSFAAAWAFFAARNLRHLAFHHDRDQAGMTKLLARHVPTTYFCTADLVERGRWRGAVSWEDSATLDHLATLLAKSSP